MNDIYNRLKALLEETGLSFADGGINQAEIYAYSKGIEFVKSYISDALDDVLADGNSDCEKYAKLLNIDSSRYTLQELKNEIVHRLAMNFAQCTVSDHDRAFDDVNSGEYEMYSDPLDDLPTILFKNVQIEDLPQLGKFIEGFTCLSEYTLFDGNGLDFAGWGLWNQNFYNLDKMNLPFYIIDYLRSDMIE